MKSLPAVALVFVIVVGAVGAAEAAGAATAGDAVTFESLDKNGNGLLNRAEARAVPALGRVFGVLDKDRDSQIDKAEFARFEATGGDTRGRKNRSH